MFKKTRILKNNLKLLQERNEDLYKRDIEHQKLARENERKLREQISSLRIKVEDITGFYNQEKEAKEELIKQRDELKKEIAKLKRKNTLLRKEIENGK